MSKEIKEYDDRDNLIHFKEDYHGFGYIEYWSEYDENNNKIYYKNNTWDEEHWYKYDENNNEIEITEKEYKEIKFRKKEKEYNSRTKCSRFEIMDI